MIILTGLAFTLGLIMAASDGDYFPFVNIIGVLIFFLILPLSKRIIE
jgi:hypothetical protein